MREKCGYCGKYNCICNRNVEREKQHLYDENSVEECHLHENNCGCCHDHEDKEESSKLDIILYVISIIIFILTLLVAPEKFKVIGYLLTILLSGAKLLIQGIKNIFKLNFEEDTLMTIAIIAAFILGEFPESCMVILLFKIGEFLEDKAVEKSNENIMAIADIKEEYTNVLDEEGNENKAATVDVKVGAKILIKSGEKIPLDSIILEGEADLDTSAITGESKSIRVKENDKILSGSINLNGVLIAQVEKDYKNSMATQIVDLVYEASNNKGKTEKFITKFSKIYTPTVIVLAILIAVLPPLFGILDFKTWIQRSLIFLVASCPCSIVISVPVAMFAGIGAMSKKGLLVKGTKHIENLSKVKLVAFDKTGTLTTGKMTLDKLEILGNYTKEEILQYIVSIEKFSNHPISKVFLDFKENVDIKEVKGFEEIPGFGLYAQVEGKEILFGNAKLLEKYKVEIPKNMEDATYLSINNILAAYVTLKEEIKEENLKLTSDLKKQGVKKVIMLTGDNQTAAQKVGKELAIDEVYSGLLPKQKQQKIINLKETKEKVVFVGDGINDSIVLTSSDFGISMGLGTEIANQISDAILITNQISNIPECIKIAKKTINIVKTNISFSLIIKLIVFVLGFLGIAPIWLAVLADTGVTMLTVANSIRIFRSQNS